MHELDGRRADRATGRKGGPSVVLYRCWNFDIRRREREVGGLPSFRIVISRARQGFFPGQIQGISSQIVDLHIDHTGGGDDESGVRLDDMEIALGVAIKINMPEEIRRLGLNADLMGNTGLPGEIARSEVNQTVASRDI
jgi:hypothetical protein